MQNPTGMKFNPDTARNEMVDFFDVALSPTAIHKFLHTLSSSYTLAAVVVVGISCWYLLKGRHSLMARRSIVVASVFGFFSIMLTLMSGDGSAKEVAKHQPIKLAAMEGYFEGRTNAGVVVLGALSTEAVSEKYPEMPKFLFEPVELPGVISLLSFGNVDAYVPGIKDFVEGNKEQGIPSVRERAERGMLARTALKDYTHAKKAGDKQAMAKHLEILEANFKDFGYSYFLDNPNEIIPHIPLTFYSFHIMVMLGFWFVLLFLWMLWSAYKKKLGNSKMLLRLGILTVPLAYVASECGWMVAEIGRQPWVIQDLMPTMAAVSKVSAVSVQITFYV